jgi:hypothetical protein
MMEKDFLCFDPRLIEESVFAALKADPAARRFHGERVKLYKIPAEEEREAAFMALHRDWFQRLGLASPIEQALEEQPLLFALTRSCVVARAWERKQEGAELFVRGDDGMSEKAKRTVRVLIRVESLLRPAALLEFLRREFFHIVDMVDPDFQYQPALPSAEGGPLLDGLLRERYQALWDTTISGRMVRRGWLDGACREYHRRGFARAFPMLGQKSEEAFSRFFDMDGHTHGDLITFCQRPAQEISNDEAHQRGTARCPLCGFPTQTFHEKPDELGSAIHEAIRSDFPNWRPALGICRQCADLYCAGALSMGAARLLPGAAVVNP